MKRHAVIVTINAKHSVQEISQFWNVARSFVHKVLRELEASDGNVESVAKRRKYKSHSVTVITSQFVQQVQTLLVKSIRAISRALQVSECIIRRIDLEDIRYKSYVMYRGQFMSAQTLLLHIKL